MYLKFFRMSLKPLKFSKAYESIPKYYRDFNIMFMSFNTRIKDKEYKRKLFGSTTLLYL